MEKLGIQWPALLIQVINFGLLVFLLQKFLYKPLLKKLDERTSKIAASLALEETLKQKSEALDTKEAEILKKAKKTAQEYLEQAKQDALVDRDLVLKDAKSENEKLLAKLESQQQAHLTELKQELVKSTVSVSSEMLRSVLSDVLTESDQRKILAESLKNLKSAK